MKEYMKNKNEYKQDGVLCIEKVRRCECVAMKGDKYVLNCWVTQRGEHEYYYDRGRCYIGRWGENKGFGLGEQARETVEDAVRVFENDINTIKFGAFEKIYIEELDFNILYKHDTKCEYYFAFELMGDDGERIATRIFSGDLGELLHYIQRIDSKSKDWHNEVFGILRRSDKETINKNPLYLHGMEKNDELLIKQLKVHYDIATKEDCEWLGKKMGVRILPPLENNKTYEVKKPIDIKLLYDSGYLILHRPYFSMMGCTHEKWILNPCTKQGVDAAKVDSDGISFEEYLNLFNEGNQD